MGITFDIITVVHEASITDWIQAVAAIIAIPGAIAAFIVLFKRDREKEEVVKQLTEQTKHLGEQTHELGSQTEQFKAQVFQLSKIHEAIAKGIEVLSNDAEVREMNRRNELRPYLVLATTRIQPKSNRIEYEFFNKGGTAEKVQVFNFKGKPAFNQFQLRAMTGQYIQLDIIHSNPVLEEWEFEFQYEDADGIPYRQRVVRNRKLGPDLEVSPPILMNQAEQP